MEKLLQMFAEVLDIEKSEIKKETSREDLTAWDSFAHLQLVAEFEERFKVKIPFDDILRIKTVGDFLKFVKE